MQNVQSASVAALGCREPAESSGAGLPPPPPGEGRARCLPARGVLYHEGDEVSRAYLVRSGLVKLVSYLPGGRVRIIRLHGRGHWLGLEGLLGLRYSHTAVALNALELEHVAISRLMNHYGANPSALMRLLCQWHNALAQADKWIADFSTGAVRLRVARLMEYLAQLDAHDPRDPFTLPTVADMADILGVTPESVSRHMAVFKRIRVLQREGEGRAERFRLDPGRLQALLREAGAAS